jgi:hypothetical protein
MNDNDNEQDWEQEEVEIERPVGVVVSARLSQELADRVFGEAQRRGVPTSAVVREALELLLEGGYSPSSLDLVISSADAPIAFFTGRSGLGRTGAAPAEVALTQSPSGQLIIKG